MTKSKESQYDFRITDLLIQYVRFLTTVGDYISKWWPDAFVETRDRDEIVVITVEGGEVWNLLALHKSLEWLEKVAAEQNCLAEVRDAGIIKWETGLFKSTFEEGSVQAGIRTYVQGSIRFRLTSGALKGEIARMSLPQ